MSDSGRPRRTLRQSTKLIPTATATNSPNPYSKRVSYSGGSARKTPSAPAPPPETPTPARKKPGPKPGSTRRGGGRRSAAASTPTSTPKRPECFNNKPSKYHNDYHYGSDFEEDSEDEEPDPPESDEDEDSLQDSGNEESSYDETLDVLKPEDIEEVNSSMSNLPIWLNPDIQLDPLIIPQSSEDLVLNDKNLIFPLVTIYETIIKFYKALRITPFKFEDFCACISSPESSVMLVEIHIQIIKSILREDEGMNVTYGPLEYKDSIQAAFYFIDNITWVDTLLTYFKTEKSLEKYSQLIKDNNYPFCSIEVRIKILNVLLNIYLSTNAARENLLFDGLQHEDYCRICGRLGELICCETCTGVAHLGCINPPITDPPDEWKCTTCTKHLIPGLSDCIRDEDKTSIRHEKLGNDRHGRSYWFLVRRILVESEDGKTAWYYSTQNQFQELLDTLNPTLEADLIGNINFHKEEILAQMNITEKLTNASNTQHRKTYIDFENSQLAQLQKSRELINKQNELEKLKAQEEILMKKAIEDAEKLKQEEEVRMKSELEKKRIREERLERRNKRKYGDLDFEDYDDASFLDMDFDISQGENSNSNSMDKKASEPMENGDDTPHSIDKMDELDNDGPTKESGEDDMPPKLEKEVIEDETAEAKSKSESTNAEEKPVKMDIDVAEVEVGSTAESPSKNNKTYPKHESPIKSSLSDKIVLPESPLRPVLLQVEREIETLKAELMNSDEKERTTRLKSTGLYKLGLEIPANYKSYVNYYSTDSTALSKLQHNEERDKKRYMSHKFSLTQVSDFKWNGQFITTLNVQSLIKQCLMTFEANVPLTLMHCNWPQLRKPWILALTAAKNIQEFKAQVILFRGCLRDCIFNNIWWDGVGHLKLVKMNPLERDEQKKVEKRLKKSKDDEDDKFKVTVPFVKYTIPCKHQIWKQKGEEYRLHGQFGWIWMRSTRVRKPSASYKYNLINGPYKYVIQVKSDHNKIKTMLIDPTVYNKLMAKRNLNMGGSDSSKSPSAADVKVKVEESNESSSSCESAAVKVEAVEEALSAAPVKSEVQEDESDTATVVAKVMHNLLAQVEQDVNMNECKQSAGSGSSTPKSVPPPKKYNAELINVSLGIVSANRILYPKIAHRINILDDLLGHRMKLLVQEETQIASKFNSEYKFIQNMSNYKCYSYSCKNKVSQSCYSPLCQLTKVDRSETSSKVFLKRVNTKPEQHGKTTPVYPLVSTYMMNKKPNIFVLEKRELMKLARTAGRYTTPSGFNTNNKTNTLWNYPCGRPSFYKVWEYNLLNCFNISSIGMGIRILYACIRWDDLQVKPPMTNDCKNQITTDTEIITSEILQRRVLGHFMNKVQYLRRKEIVPIDLPKTVREITPSRLGLRKRKRTELQDKTEPTVVEEWVNENQVEIWEIRYYGDRIERPKLEVFRKNDSPNTRIRSGVILQKPDKLDPSSTQTNHRTYNSAVNANANTTTTVEHIVEPVQRVVHLSKRDNHAKNNNNSGVIKVQIPTASQQLQQQKSGGVVLVTQQNAAKVLPTSSILTPARQQQQIMRNVVQVQQQQNTGTPETSISGIALQQIQDKPKSPAKRIFVSGKGKDGNTTTPKGGGVNRKVNASGVPTTTLTLPATQQQQQQMHIVAPADQRLQIVRGTDGKLQLRGLLPGQHAYQTADGKIHVITATTSGTTNTSGAEQQQSGIVTQAGTQQQQLVTTTNATQPQQQQQQIVLTSNAQQQQQILLAPTTPGGKPQQIVMAAATPGGKSQQLIMSTTPGGKPQLMMTGNKQIVMANTPGGGKQQFVMAGPGGASPRFQFVTTGPGGKQQIIQMAAATPTAPIAQPLINISSHAMKTVISNSPIIRTVQPNIIKGKQQTPILLANQSKSQAQGTSQIQFVNQGGQILQLAGNPQQQQQQSQPSLVPTNQGNKIMFSDGTGKTFMINASGLNESQINALAQQFQQKKFVIKANDPPQGAAVKTEDAQANANANASPAASVSATSVKATTVTPQAMTTQQIVGTNAAGQLIMMSAPKTNASGQQILTQQMAIATGAPGQPQQLVMVSMSPSSTIGGQPIGTNAPIRFTTQQIVTSMGQPMGGQQQTILVAANPGTTGRIGHQFITQPGILGRQIVSADRILGQPQLPQPIRPSPNTTVTTTATTAGIMQPPPPPKMTAKQVIAATNSAAVQFLASQSAKQSSLPISIVSPSKTKFQKTIPIGNNLNISTSGLSSVTTSKLATTSASPISPTKSIAGFPPAKPTFSGVGVTMIPTVPMTPAERPYSQDVKTTSPAATAGTNILYQKLVPTTTSPNQQTIAPKTPTHIINQQGQVIGTTTPNSLSHVPGQIIETSSGSKFVLQGGNKFSPEELVRIQAQLKKQFETEQHATVGTVSNVGNANSQKPKSLPESTLSSIDESINMVIQNANANVNPDPLNVNVVVKSPKKKPKILSRDKQLGHGQFQETKSMVPSQLLGNSITSPPASQPLAASEQSPGADPNNKINKKLFKVQQSNTKTKSMAVLTKHKDALKKDIEKKRNMMENDLKIAIQKEIAQEKILAQSPVPIPSPTLQPLQQSSSSRGVKRKSTAPNTPVPKPKKKKGKGRRSRDNKEEFDLSKMYCICNTPYDDTKFYVGCDKCSNWFHGDCIGISQAMSKCLSDYICDSCQTTEKTYCLCKQPYDDSQFYICCDKCQDWFHGRCIGIIQSESSKIEEYICPNCDPTTELNSPNLKILKPDDFALMQKLTKQMMLHKASWAFIKPVDIKDAPNYYKVIKEPMDLQTVDMRVSEHVYTRLRDFIGDVTKIFDNCRYYNPENSEFYKLANTLELFFKEKIILLRKKLM